jgi:Regulator of Chromosome Condensation (RCC1) repeat protein
VRSSPSRRRLRSARLPRDRRRIPGRWHRPVPGRCGRGWQRGFGQLGTGVFNTFSQTPVAVLGARGRRELTGVTAVAAGSSFSLAKRSDGTVWAWGFDEFGQLGDGLTRSRARPVPVCRDRWPESVPDRRRRRPCARASLRLDRVGVGPQRRRPARRWDDDQPPGARDGATADGSGCNRRREL